jgi:hypothetical protein
LGFNRNRFGGKHPGLGFRLSFGPGNWLSFRLGNRLRFGLGNWLRFGLGNLNLGYGYNSSDGRGDRGIAAKAAGKRRCSRAGLT